VCAHENLYSRLRKFPLSAEFFPCWEIRITGNQLRAGRGLAGLSMEDLADRARLLANTTIAASRAASQPLAARVSSTCANAAPSSCPVGPNPVLLARSFEGLRW
jgi:hypothetical protein